MMVKRTQKLDENQIDRIDCENTISDQTTPKFNLEEMVAQLPLDYETKEESFGQVVGREEW
jgi:hypothetical protein